jgi:general secretion pathway protein B
VSYILDALNKAERDRQVSRVPGLATRHRGADEVRRVLWPWVAASVLVMGAALGYGLWGAGRPEPAGEAVRPPATAGQGTSISSPGHGPSPSPVDRASKPEEPDITSGPDVGRASPGLEPARPRVAPAPPARTPKARAAVAQPRAPAVASPDPRETRRAGATQRSAPPPAADAPELPSSTAADTAAGQVARPAPAEPGTPLTLDVLVYSDVPAERMVFINGRKYVEGQAVNEDAVVEQITQEGAILRRQGKRVVLRPRLNPYARPGSP